MSGNTQFHRYNWDVFPTIPKIKPEKEKILVDQKFAIKMFLKLYKGQVYFDNPGNLILYQLLLKVRELQKMYMYE